LWHQDVPYWQGIIFYPGSGGFIKRSISNGIDLLYFETYSGGFRMKTFLAICTLTVILLSGCIGENPQVMSTTTTTTPEEVVTTFLQALNNEEYNTCLNLVTEDVLIMQDPPGSKFEGKTQFSTNLQQSGTQNQKFTIISPPTINENTLTLSVKIESDDLSVIGLESLKTTMEFQIVDGKIKSWLTKPDVIEWKQVVTASSGGIGIKIETAEKGIRIKELAKNSPALEAGARVGDIIIAVNGFSSVEMRDGEMALRIRGPIGSKVTLTVIHEESTQTEDVEVMRVDMTTISY
jgi:limonene-1,2-epoxide hydrolase